VPKAIRSRIFEPFYTTRATGTGLGLAFVDRIVTEHGGSVTVGSAPSGGALFEIRLPAESL
jgi:signal transduction histidine kinase